MSELYDKMQESVKGFASVEYLEHGAAVFTFDNNDNCTGGFFVPKKTKFNNRKKVVGFFIFLAIVLLVYFFFGIKIAGLFLGAIFVQNISNIKNILRWQEDE